MFVFNKPFFQQFKQVLFWAVSSVPFINKTVVSAP